MVSVVSPRTSSLHRSSNSAPGYFEFQPARDVERIQLECAMEMNGVYRLDAFHQRPCDLYDLPKDIEVYAKKALPAVPSIQTTLRKSSSSNSLRSPVSPLDPSPRPSLSSQCRAFTADFYDRPLPPLPSLSRVPSADSLASSRPAESDVVVPVRRPRAMRSISFRNFLNRNTYPAPTTVDSQRSVSAMSATSDTSSHDSRHDSILEEILEDKVPESTATRGRRPSTLSLSSLRSRKHNSEPLPPMPRIAPVKGNTTTGSSRRWGIFHTANAISASTTTSSEDTENVPPVPITPPPVTELTCHRCYYFSMRNCNGWVMGGPHGDACDSCTMHGYFGSP